ncbi:MAG: cell division protein FtsZ [Candidatus Poribacteria bacterium]|nr:cell division protein FtsZ [Candidatus Poribacteria bacterium]
MIEFEQEDFEALAKIKVIGVGGGGSNAVKRMIEQAMAGVEFYVVNTDHQALQACPNATRIPIGQNMTGGLGAGADPEIGKKAAEEDRERLQGVVEGADMVFVTAGMGGGTGTGAAPIIAALSKESTALTIAVVTRPFDFEGRRRADQAESGLENLRENADSVIVIPNQRLIDVVDRKLPIRMAFRMGDQILHHGVQSISDLITVPGEINLDFADVKTIMSNAGGALMGIGTASGDNRAELAAQEAISSPLLEEGSIKGATGIIVNIIGPPDMTMQELEEAMAVIKDASETEQVIFGLAYNEELQEMLRVTVIATGFNSYHEASRPGATGPMDDLFNRDYSSAPPSNRPSRQNFQSSRQQSGSFTESTPRPGTEPPQSKDFPQRNSNENPDEVLDIPAFLRVRNPKDKK